MMAWFWCSQAVPVILHSICLFSRETARLAGICVLLLKVSISTCYHYFCFLFLCEHYFNATSCVSLGLLHAVLDDGRKEGNFCKVHSSLPAFNVEEYLLFIGVLINSFLFLVSIP